MATVYLHIGLPKTGTTAIQNFLWDNTPVLGKNGICYPDFDARYPHVKFLRNAHFLIASCKKADDSDQLVTNENYTRFMDQIAELGTHYDRIFLSEEALWSAKRNQHAFWEKIKTDFEKRGVSLRVIVYLRQQDTFVQSLYRQKVKARLTDLPFSDFLSVSMKSYPLDYYSYLKRLAAALGKENLIIRVYEKEQYHGKEHDLFSDFLDIFGLSVGDGFTIGQAALNLPLDNSKHELRRLLNKASDPRSGNTILTQSFRDIRSYAANGENSYGDVSFFRPGEQAAYLESFAESNSRVAREFLGREDGVLFRETADKILPEYQVDNDALLKDTVLLYARSILHLEEECRALRQELQNVRSELRDVRENVVLYRLKRKLRHVPADDEPNVDADTNTDADMDADDIS